MINIKRPKSKFQKVISNLGEHLFEIAAGLFVITIIGLSGYIVIQTNKQGKKIGNVAGVQTSVVIENNNLLNAIAKESNYKYFFDALTRTGVFEKLKGSEKFTIFAPDDAAFRKLGEAEIANLFSDINRLKVLVENHIVSGELKRLNMGRADWMRTINGKFVDINQNSFGTLFNTSKLMSSGVEVDNGIVYQIDSIIF